MAICILSGGPAYRVATETSSVEVNIEGDAVAMALSISESAQCEVRVLDEEDNIVLVALPPATEASL